MKDNQQLSKKFYIKSGSLGVTIEATSSTNALEKVFKNLKRYIKDPSFCLGLYVYINCNGGNPCDDDEMFLTEKVLNENYCMKYFEKLN